MSKSSTKRKARAQARAQSQGRRNILLLGMGIVLAIVAILLVVFLSAGGSEEISIAEAAAKRDQGAFILDVRTTDEWEEYHIPDSTLIPLDELAARIDEVPRDQEVVVVCRSGNRSKQGRDILTGAGFTNVSSMAGGLTAWVGQGYSTETGP